MTPSETADSQPRYRLKFIPDALAEWGALDGSIKNLLRKLLKKRLEKPHLPGSRLHGDLNNCYKIKLKKQGYRLVYTVEDDMIAGSSCRYRPSSLPAFSIPSLILSSDLVRQIQVC